MTDGIKKSELKELEKILREKHRNLRSDMGSLTSDLRESGEQSGDVYGVRENIDVEEREGEMEELEIRLVEEALERIADKRYGYCLECGNLINVERLRIVPEARYCVKCEEKRERGSK